MRTSVTLPHSTEASVGVLVRRAQSLVDGIYPTTQLTCQGMGYGQPVETQFYYRLTPASHALAGALQSSIHKAVAAAAAATCPAGSGSCKMDGETVRIAHSTVDDLLADEYDKSDGAYAVYILNPQVAVAFLTLTPSSSSVQQPHTSHLSSTLTLGELVFPTQAAQRPYLYEHVAADDAGADSHTHAGCASPLWVGRRRYVWVDLTAAPTTWGPHSSGPGVVLPSTLPRVRALSIPTLSP